MALPARPLGQVQHEGHDGQRPGHHFCSQAKDHCIDGHPSLLGSQCTPASPAGAITGATYDRSHPLFLESSHAPILTWPQPARPRIEATHTLGASALSIRQESVMREEHLYPLLVQLLAQGAWLEESSSAGRRFTLVAESERLPVSAALALKLAREGRIRALCRLSGKTLWVAA